MHLLTKSSADLPEGASDPGRNHASILLTNRPCRLPPAHPGMKLGRAHASLWIPALTLTPTLSLREREIWLLLLSVPLEEVRHSVGRASPTGGLAWNNPHPYILHVSTIGCPYWAGSRWRRVPVPEPIFVPSQQE